MIDHERALDLAATAIDFPLPPAEMDALSRHLATCPVCTVAVERLREDAAGLAGLERRPAPSHVREAVVRAAVGGRSASRRGAGLRWSFAAVLLAVLAVGGTFVAGAMLERSRDVGPTPTDQPAPRATDGIVPSRLVGWMDLGIIDAAFDGRSVQLVLPAPERGLVALGRDQRSTLPAVWTSDDGSTWTLTTQPEDLFSGRVPTGGVLHDGALWVVAWDIASQGAQRAIWGSSDGVTWARVGGNGGLLGTEASDLDMTAGPAGLLVWAADGRAWTATDGTSWIRSDANVTGVVDGAVDDRFRLVASDDGRASLVTSADGRAWGSPSRVPIAGEAQAGIESTADGTLLAWVDGEPYRATQTAWRRADGSPEVPSGTVVGGPGGFAAIAAPTADGVQRAWVGDGRGEWRSVRSEATAEGARVVVGVAPVADGWYVLTRQGTTYRGWLLRP